MGRHLLRLPACVRGNGHNLKFFGQLAEWPIAPGLNPVWPGEPRHERSNRSLSATRKLITSIRPRKDNHRVLQLDIQGTPQSWLSLEQAATYIASESVAWSDGDGPLATLRGGFNAQLGRMSTIDVFPIIALHGAPRVNLFEQIPTYSRHKLFRRDRFTCAYCGEVRPERELSADHIVPQAQGGGWTWMNLVTACKRCNGVKADRRPDQADMPLLYLPYVPSRFEDFLLQGRHIRADVHDWLASRLPRGSRLI